MTRHGPNMRDMYLERLREEIFDLVVIGGGITGAGIAQDSASRELKVALIEKKDFASGTSSRSSKLIHGGLRYLKRFELGLTREACHERGLLRRLAPGVVRLSPFLIPIYPTLGNASLLSLGLWVYDRLAPTDDSERYKRISKEDAIGLAPHLHSKNLNGGLVYYDAITDDARLTLAIVKSALDRGAVAANYVQAIGLLKCKGKVFGVAVRDLSSGKEFEIRSRCVVNASGVWIDQVCTLDDNQRETIIQPSKGVHIVIPGNRLGANTALLFASSIDRRLMFVVPWGSVTIVGTTDTPYHGDLDHPRADHDDVLYILNSLNQLFALDLSRKDIISTFAGLRPLVKDHKLYTHDLSRRHKIFQSPSGLITIAGGKLTTYRKMACDAVDLVIQELGKTPKCITDTIPLIRTSAQFEAWKKELEPDILTHLQTAYGEETPKVLDQIKKDSALSRRIIEGLPYIRAEILYATRHEMATTVEDFLARRTRILIEDKQNGLGCAQQVANHMATELGWDDQELMHQILGYTNEAQFYTVPKS